MQRRAKRKLKLTRARERGRRPKTCGTRNWRGTDLVVTYTGILDAGKDHAIRKALGKYNTGSGYSFVGERDHVATVPDGDLKRVLAQLKKIRGIKTKKLVLKWVLCR